MKKPWIAIALLSLLPVQDAAAQEPPRLNDAEIAHVAVTANAIDIEVAALVPDRAQTEEVRTFARTMVTAHTGVNERAAALAGRLGVTPLDNEVSRSLRTDADQATARLENLRGSAFDRAYLEREVAYHTAVLAALEDLLIPATRNAELKALLEEVRPVIAAHLEHARHVAAGLPLDR